MHQFNYHRADDLAQAGDLLKNNPGAVLLAGGQTLIATMKQRLASPDMLVDIGRIDSMKKIETQGEQLSIGAVCSHAKVAQSQIVQDFLPSLSRLAEHIGDPHVRHMGTIGGSLANNDPSADYPAGLLALKGVIKTDRRKIAGDDFITGIFETCLQEGEIITSIDFARPQKAAYAKFPSPASRYALVGVFVAQFADGVRVAVTGAGSCAFRETNLEAALNGDFHPRAVDNVRISADAMIGDIHGSAEYRAHLVSIMTKRAITATQ